MSQAKIAVEDAHKTFGDNRVLRGVSFDVQPGESFALIGGSGVGKSVVIKSILGLIKLDKGQILVNGKDNRKQNSNYYNQMGMLFQEGALFDSMLVWQNVAFRFLRGKGRLSPSEAKAIAMAKLERVGLAPDVADKFPSELSGGMKKRVGLARAIASEPEIIFFDEPTTGLDPIRANIINKLIRGIVTETKATAVMITHDMESVRTVADRAALLYDGRIVWLGNSNGLQQSDNPYLNQFLEGATSGPIKMVV